MTALVLETSTPRGGVALFRDGDPLFSESFTADRSHSSELFVVIERALAGQPAPGRIIIGLGPGSYAGVRIAIAAAIGLSIANRAESIGIPSIVALGEGEYLAVGDARRGGYWIAHIRDGELVSGPEVVTREVIQKRMAGATVPIYSSEEIGFPGIELRYPSVDRLGRLGNAGRGIFARGALEPIYLREPHITKPKEVDDYRSGMND